MFIVEVSYRIDEKRNKESYIKIYKSIENINKFEKDIIEQYRNEALKIINDYKSKGTIDNYFRNYDIENIIDENEDDLEETIKSIISECFCCIGIPEEINLNSNNKLLFSKKLELNFY